MFTHTQISDAIAKLKDEIEKTISDYESKLKKQKENFINFKKKSDNQILKLTERNKALSEENDQIKKELQQCHDGRKYDPNNDSTNDLDGKQKDVPLEVPGLMTTDPTETNNHSTNNVNYAGEFVEEFHPDYYYINAVHTDNVEPISTLGSTVPTKSIKWNIPLNGDTTVKSIRPTLPLKSILKSKIPSTGDSTVKLLQPTLSLKSILKSKIPSSGNSTGKLSSPKDNTSCRICAKRFSTPANMMRHVRGHQGIRFVCEYANCNAKFTQKSSLKVHIQQHEGLRPYMCEVCGKKFTQSKTLGFHLRTHTGERPFQCAHCEKSFIQKSNLIRHLSKLRKGRLCRDLTRTPFKCQECNRHLASKQSLRRHMKGHERSSNNADKI